MTSPDLDQPATERDVFELAQGVANDEREKVRNQVNEGIAQADFGELIPADTVFEKLESRAIEIDGSATSDLR